MQLQGQLPLVAIYCDWRMRTAAGLAGLGCCFLFVSLALLYRWYYWKRDSLTRVCDQDS